VKNTLGDLNNYLFEQLDKLGDEDLTGDELDSEIRRSEAMAKVSEQIIRTGELQFKAMQHMTNMDMTDQRRFLKCLRFVLIRGGSK